MDVMQNLQKVRIVIPIISILMTKYYEKEFTVPGIEKECIFCPSHLNQSILHRKPDQNGCVRNLQFGQ